MDFPEEFKQQPVAKTRSDTPLSRTYRFDAVVLGFIRGPFFKVVHRKFLSWQFAYLQYRHCHDRLPISHTSTHNPTFYAPYSLKSQFIRSVTSIAPRMVKVGSIKLNSAVGISLPHLHLWLKPFSLKFVAISHVLCGHGLFWCTILVTCAVCDLVVMIVFFFSLCSLFRSRSVLSEIVQPIWN